jgi:hypothetical protein
MKTPDISLSGDAELIASQAAMRRAALAARRIAIQDQYRHRGHARWKTRPHSGGNAAPGRRNGRKSMSARVQNREQTA